MTDSSSQRPEDMARWSVQAAEKALAEIREQGTGASENDLHEALKCFSTRSGRKVGLPI